MTQAKLVTSPAQGHGITDKHTNALYQALVDGKPTKPIIALVILEPVATAQRKTAQGLHRTVTFEAARLEPVLDANQAGELMYLTQALYEQRTSTGAHRPLPLGIPGLEIEEKRQAVMERLEEWAAEAGMTGGEFEAAWREHFGIGDLDYSAGDHGVPGDYRKAGVQQLLEFGFAHDALDTPEDEEDDEGDESVGLHAVDDEVDEDPDNDADDQAAGE